MKKNLTSVVALVCALLTLAIALFCLVTLKRTSEELSSKIAALEAQVAQLQTQTEASDVAAEELPDASCNLLVDSWSTDEKQLTADLFAVAQLEEGLTVSQAQLYLTSNEHRQVKDVEMLPGEGENAFEANLPGLIFDLPELKEGEELALELIVTFTGGRNIHARVNWYFEDSQLQLVSG